MDVSPRDLQSPLLYINRELSWLEFNYRVLLQAAQPERPLLERLKFLSIVASNLDEFFMVRVAGLKRQVKSETVQRGPDGMTAQEQLHAIAARCHQIVGRQYELLKKEVLPGLSRHNIRVRRLDELTEEQRTAVNDYFHRQIFPVLTPLALDPAHPFPHLRNRSLNLVVTLRKSLRKRSPHYLAVVQVPAVLPRLAPAQSPGEGHTFVLLEDLITERIDELFQGLQVTGSYAFRITRDSDLNFDEEEVEDLLETIEQEVRKREWGDAVRLEVAADCDPEALQALLLATELTEEDVYQIAGPLNLTDFMALSRLPGYAELRDPPFVAPVIRELNDPSRIFETISRRDILLHHPFESFNSVVDFVQQAATDPEVLAIKLTLYRTSGDSPIIAALATAAANGKQVTAVVELKARFDEENNIVWARRLERAGVHVVYGLVGLKTHCKLMLVVRRSPGDERLRRYVHLGTGNYNPTTARLYTDLGLLTSSLKIGQDVSRLFNVLTGYSEFPNWRRLAVAPLGLRERILELIHRETANAQAGKNARIVSQMNSLVDPDVIEALYQASQAGVVVELIVRGICCLRAGVPGISHNIRVTSLVGRFLEHCRILYVQNGGSPEIYLSSGDWMPRNLSRRVETLFPIEDPALRERLINEILAVRLQDTVNSYELEPDGSYRPVKPKRNKAPLDSQLYFQQIAHERHSEAQQRAVSADLLVHDPTGDPPRLRPAPPPEPETPLERIGAPPQPLSAAPPFEPAAVEIEEDEGRPDDRPRS